ncbi:MAG: EAL domain-containing protein [Pseudomonadota bacterium]|nr:EAL domain-containing protein [Pseudomonadota bacterium]
MEYPVPEYRASSSKILIVDDEPRLRTSLRRLIAPHGYALDLCGSGSEAIANLQRARFDLILLDLVLPDMTGLDVMEFISGKRLDTTVIVVSGDTSINSAIGTLRRGAYDFIRKPYEPEELLKAIDNALRKRYLEKINRRISVKLEHSERSYRYLVDSSPDIIYTLNQQGNFSFLNDRIESLLGFARDELLGKHYTAIIHDEDCDRAAYVFNERRTGERGARNVELRLKCKQGSERYRLFATNYITVVLNAMGVYKNGGGVQPMLFAGTHGVARDISERKKAEDTISYQAYHDMLTDLPNRALFKDRLGLAITHAQRSGHLLAMMFLDLDRFKLVNDTLGHVKGDELLQAVAQRLKNTLRKGDTLARVGGDEFTLLLPEINSRDDAALIAQKVLDELRRPFLIEEQDIFSTVSIGIAVFPDDGDGIDDLIKNADMAMYHGKWEGKNNYQFYSKAMNVVFQQRLAGESELRKALDRDEFVLHYQPQVNIVSRKIIGMEALIRWQHPTRGLVSPAEFMPLAVETGLMPRISDWVLRHACAQLRSWREAGLPPVRVAVNLSPQDIEQSRFVEKVLGVLQDNYFEANALEIEITENVMMRDIENTMTKLSRLGALGVKIAIDDFGIHYASLNYLKKFPIHTIKIDQSFVQDITSDASDAPIITAIVAIAKGFRLNLIAEGVETLRQLEVIRALHCVEMQGFLFSAPLSPADATRILANQQELFLPLNHRNNVSEH